MNKLLATLSVLVIGACGCGGGSSAGACKSTADCGSGQACSSGACVTTGQVCNTTTPCPGALNCCSGACTDATCCTADTDCNGGHCQTGVCVDGPRVACSSNDDCNGVGTCLATLGSCVECIVTSDCQQGFQCSAEHTCAVLTGCTDDTCASQGLVCAPEEGSCRACVSDAECGRNICTNGQCVPCDTDDQCGQDRVCQSGACVRGPGIPCASDGDCGGLICVVTNGSEKTCEPCYDDVECPQDASCNDGYCISADAQCQNDADCDVPSTVCNYGSCVAGCQQAGCTSTDICNPNTGRCVPFTSGIKALGDSCNYHAECTSNVCWPIDTSETTAVRVCGQTCATDDDCTAGYYCYELGDGNTCLPDGFFTPGGAYDIAAGGLCGGNFVNTACESGYCNAPAHTCYEMCGDTKDCAGLNNGSVCTLRRTVAVDKDGDGTVENSELTFTQLCETPPLHTLAPNSVCGEQGQVPTDADHAKCETGYCVQTPDGTQIARCAQGCCTPSDCTPDAPICKPIDVWDGVRDGGVDDPAPYGFQKVCLYREWSGTGELGSSCTQNSDCKSEICAASDAGNMVCTQTCCTNADCAGFSWSSGCRPPFYDSPVSYGEEPVADAYFDQIVHALGRTIFPGGSPSFGVAPICFPR